jgi:hypothetical protein
MHFLNGMMPFVDKLNAKTMQLDSKWIILYYLERDELLG